MPWDNIRYQKAKQVFANQLRNGDKKPYELMLKYKECIQNDDFESAKALDEILEPLNYHVTDTHDHIPCLNQKHH